MNSAYKAFTIEIEGASRLASILKEHGIELRNNSEQAREILVETFKRGSLKGLRFKKDYSIGDYTVDFVCLKSRLIVEIDGEINQNNVLTDFDDARTSHFEKQGYQVLRFENKSIIEDLSWVLSEIKNCTS
jgi:5-methyltetrahydrofolate--homocysteine methyltransferase